MVFSDVKLGDSCFYRKNFKAIENGFEYDTQFDGKKYLGSRKSKVRVYITV